MFHRNCCHGRLQSVFCSSASIHSDSFSHTHRRLNFHLSRHRCTQFARNVAPVSTSSACRHNRRVHRHNGVALSSQVSRRQSTEVASAISETKCMSSAQASRGGITEEDDHKRGSSSSGSDDVDVDAFFARKSTFDRIQSSGVIACLRSDNEEVALNAGRAALDGGVSVLEVTMRTPGAFQVIKKLIYEYPSATIGAGTVLTWQDAESAKEAGATFLMSPVTDKELVQAHINSKVLFGPGAMTPSEVLQARRWGASCVKLYPVSLMGGIQYVEMLKKLFPYVPIIPANGVSLDMVESYLEVGSTAVILSDAIFNKAALTQHDFPRILQQSKIVVALATKLERVDTSTLKYVRNGQRYRACT